MEAEALRWSLLIIGSLVIVGLAVHGIWLSRKNSEKKENAKKHKKSQEYQPSGWEPDANDYDEVVDDSHDGMIDEPDIKFDSGVDEAAVDLANDISTKNDFDDLGLGAVRIVSSVPKEDPGAEPVLAANIQAEPDVPSSKIYASVVTQPKPEYVAKYRSSASGSAATLNQERAVSNDINELQKVATPHFTEAANLPHSLNDSQQAPEPPPFLLKKDTPEPESLDESSAATTEATKTNLKPVTEQKTEANLAEKVSLTEQALNLVKRKKASSVSKRREPNIDNDQMHIDFDDQPIAKPDAKEESKANSANSIKHSAPEQPQEVLVLNVKCADDNPIPGSALLPMLLTLGFKFGDQDIFHRHVNSNGKGPVLFSLANMFKPGNFDIDNLENFTTGGISLFMILPIEGEPHQVFNMMHNAARKIADEFCAQIYDGTRTLLTKQSLQQYVEKIREFERQRLLRG